MYHNLQKGNAHENEKSVNEPNNTMLKHTPHNPLDETDMYPRGRVRNIVPETEETMLEQTNQ